MRSPRALSCILHIKEALPLRKHRSEFLFIAIGVCLVLLYQWVALYAVMPPYSSVVARARMLERHAPGIEALAVGNSKSSALDFRHLHGADGIRGFQAWRPQADLFETEYLLRCQLPMLPRLRTVYVQVDMETFFLDNALSPERENVRIHAYSSTPMLRCVAPVTGDTRLMVLGKLWPLVHAGHFRDVIQELAALVRATDRAGFVRERLGRLRVDEYGATIKRESTPDSRITPETDFGTRAESLTAQMAAIRAADSGVADRAEDALGRLIADLLDKGISVVLYSPPVYRGHHEAMHVRNAPQYADAVERLWRVSREFGVPYLDYTLDEAFTDAPGYFSDGIHLNEEGARLFTDALMAALDAYVPEGLARAVKGPEAARAL